MKIALLFLLLLFGFAGNAQQIKYAPARLSIFVDCANTYCDMTFIRSEIKGVNFSLDNQAADVHVLITSLPTGSGGSHLQLIFFGQNSFLGMRDSAFSSHSLTRKYPVMHTRARFRRIKDL